MYDVLASLYAGRFRRLVEQGPNELTPPKVGGEQAEEQFKIHGRYSREHNSILGARMLGPQ
jgi:hypothetical protein